MSGVLQALALERQPWVHQAACLSMGPRFFFPERGGEAANAKRVCRACPTRQECLDFALANGEKFGIWGGKSERERRRIRRERALKAPVPPVADPLPATGYRRVTDDDIAAIQRRYAEGGVSQQQVADEFGVAQSTVGRYVRAYELAVTRPAEAAGMTEADWIANQAIEAARHDAARRAGNDRTEAA